MNYCTTAEIAEKWKVSQRRVSILCKEGRVEGAVLKGNMWLIPFEAQKPLDPRKTNNSKGRKENEQAAISK